MRKRFLIVLLVLVGVLFLFNTFEGSKKLSGINYILLDVDSHVCLCYYEGDRFGGQCVTVKGSVRKVLWNNQYIIAYAYFESTNDKIYYIIEQFETDSFIIVGRGKNIPWSTQHQEPWKTEEYDTREYFNKRLMELNIDTAQMHSYEWKYWVGIY